jgi:hypothetical protein
MPIWPPRGRLIWPTDKQLDEPLGKDERPNLVRPAATRRPRARTSRRGATSSRGSATRSAITSRRATSWSRACAGRVRLRSTRAAGRPARGLARDASRTPLSTRAGSRTSSSTTATTSQSHRQRERPARSAAIRGAAPTVSVHDKRGFANTCPAEASRTGARVRFGSRHGMPTGGWQGRRRVDVSPGGEGRRDGAGATGTDRRVGAAAGCGDPCRCIWPPG